MFKNKKAIVTGASRGIGFAIAKHLLCKGCKVLITGRNKESLQKAADELGENCLYLAWDMAKPNEIEQKFKEAVNMLGGLDIFVNNAGVFAMCNEWGDDGLLNMSLEQWETVITVNTTSLLFGMQQAVKYFKENNIKGNVLNVTSVSGYEPVYGAYGASKSTSIALTRGWGKMFAKYGITINGIAPGPVATEMNNWHEGDPMENSRIPYGRFSTTDEIASLAMYLLSDSAKMVCGETVILDGGYSIR